jgi:hypothetical protein
MITIKSDEELEDRIIEISRKDPVVHQMLSQYLAKKCSYEQAMSMAVIMLADVNEQLRGKLASVLDANVRIELDRYLLNQ